MVEKINQDLKEAMKNQDKFAVSVLRMLKSALQLESISLKKELSDNEVLTVIKRNVKQRKDSMAEYEKYGKTEEDLAPHFECPNCQDTGYIQTENGVTLCPCIKQRLYNIQYNNSNIYDLENQNFSKFNINYYSDKPDTEKYKSKLSPNENILKIRKICDKFNTRTKE